MFLLLLFLFVSWTTHPTQAHLTYPINYCNMAATCIHDNRMVCASTVDGCSRRSFLDQCDMYEYNCDYGTRFQETYRLLCSMPTNQKVSFYQVTTKLASSKTATMISTTSTKYPAKETLNQPSTRMQFLQELLPSTVPTLTAPLGSTKMKQNDFSRHLSKTWKISTETDKTILFASAIDMQNIVYLDKSNNISTDKESFTTMTTPEIMSPSIKTHITNLVTENTKTDEPTIKLTTALTDVTNVTSGLIIPSTKLLQPTSVTIKVIFPSESVTPLKMINRTKTFTESCHNKTSETLTESFRCCKKGTWETTTLTSVLKTVEPRITTTLSTPMATSELHIDIIPTDITTKHDAAVDSSYLSDSNADLNNLYEPVVTKGRSTKMKLSRTILTKIMNNTPYRKLTPYSWWYPKPCNSNKCQRPVTWETTRKKYTKYYGHH